MTDALREKLMVVTLDPHDLKLLQQGCELKAADVRIRYDDGAENGPDARGLMAGFRSRRTAMEDRLHEVQDAIRWHLDADRPLPAELVGEREGLVAQLGEMERG